MKRIGRRILVLAVIFAAAVAGLLFYRRSEETPEEPETTYENITGAKYPVVSTEFHGMRLNALPAFTSEVDVSAMEDSLMLVGSDGSLPVTVSLCGGSLDSVSWEVRTRDNSRTVSAGTVETWEEDHDTASFTIDLSSAVANTSREYRLVLSARMKDGQDLSFYTRVIRSDDMHAEEMLDFVNAFHSSILSKDSSGYAAYLENDGTADNTDLSEVTIHSSFDQLTYGDLAPEQTGDVSLHILEMDETFGSFRLEYEIQSGSSGSTPRTFLAEEYFSVQWSQTRFYLMNYRRTLSERMTEGGRLKNGVLDLGIQEQDVQALSDSAAGVTAFTSAGELWGYRESDQTLTRIFTFREDESGQPVSWRYYGIRLLKVEDDGDVFFLVYGYMNRGRHEGQLGVACMTWQAENGALAEKFFLPCGGTYETLAEGIDTISSMGAGNMVYLMLDDTVYSIDWNGGEVVVLADQADARGFVTNEAQTAAAWEQGDTSGHSDSVQILYLESGESQTAGADSGDRVTPLGFIGEDCVLGYGHEGDTAVAGGVRVSPYYAVVIRGEDGTEEARYERDGIYISSVKVEEGQLQLNLLEKDGDSFREIDSDTLIRSDADRTGDSSILASAQDETREKIWRLTVDAGSQTSGDMTLQIPSQITYSGESDISIAESQSDQTVYYAFAEGHLKQITDTAGEAVGAVYDEMGAVTDSRGRQVWVRTGRSQTRQLAAEAGEAVSADESLSACLGEILDIQGMDRAALDEVTDDMSPYDALNELFPGLAVNLTGSPMRGLLYYIDQGNPVLLVDRDQKVTLLIGYDLFNVICYDPTSGSLVRQGQNDATSWLASDGISAIGFLSDY